MRRPILQFVALSLATGALAVAAAGCDGGESTCPTGQIQIVDFETGLGAAATDSSRVRITYDGQLEDGRQVAGEANVTVSLDETVPPGFRQGVAGMRVNGRRRFTLPPNLGFGPDGGPVGIPGCARLIFNVELHEILPEGCANTAPEVTIEDALIGTGAEAGPSSRVVVNSTLSLFNGTVVEERTGHEILLSSPAVLPGIRQGIPGMLEGGRRRVIIPPNLAYGQAGLPPSIPGCATLLYDVELVSVLP